MTKPYPYQIVGVRKIQRHRARVLLADEMGLGKTFQVLRWRQVFKPDATAVIICPASLKWNWALEASRHTNVRAEVLEGRSPPRRFKPRKGGMYVINYDVLGNPEEENRRTWSQVIKELNPDLVVVDECHNIKSRSALRTKAVRFLCKGVKHVVMVSGTPLTNRPAELWPALNILWPSKFPSFMKFAFKYCRPRRAPWGWEYKGAKNLDKLHKKLLKYGMIRRRKADVLKDLPSKTRVVIPIQLTNRKEYEEAENNFIRWLVKTHPKKAHKARRAERLVRYGYLMRLVAKLKLPACREWLKIWMEDSDAKVIAFGVHKKILARIKKDHPTCAFVDGSVAGERRQQQFDKFTRNKRCRMFLGNIRAAGTGWNGTAASAVAFVEMGWTPGEHSQAEDRGHRIGQTRGLMCYYLVAENTIEEDRCKLIDEKAKVLSKTLDGGEVEDGMDIMDKLEEVLIKRGARRRKK